MVQKRGVSMVQLSDLRQLFFGKGVSRWYNEIFKKKFFGVYDGLFLRGNNFVQKLGQRMNGIGLISCKPEVIRKTAISYRR